MRKLMAHSVDIWGPIQKFFIIIQLVMQISSESMRSDVAQIFEEQQTIDTI